jgi:hypothetical protein
MFNISENEIVALMNQIQQALDSKNLVALLEFYHPEIQYIGPAFPKPIVGIENLKTAFENHFQTPQRTSSTCGEIKVTRLADNSFVVVCLVEGRQIIYYSEQRFKGWLSRVFTEHDGKPKIIVDHFTLSKQQSNSL